MLINKINDNEFSVTVYDWIELHDDYICGAIKRDSSGDSDEMSFWMFYPATLKPLNCGDMRKIVAELSRLNS